MRRFACHGHPPGNAVQIQPDIIRRTIHIAVLCRKMAQFIQRFFAYKSAQRGQADLNALLSAAQHGFKQLLLLRQHELFCGQLPLHQIDIVRLPQHGRQQSLLCAGNAQRLTAARTVRH